LWLLLPLLLLLHTGYCIAFIYNWRMALLITGAGPLIALGGFLHMKLVFGQGTGADKLYGTANSAVTEAVSSIRVIQVRGAVRCGCACVHACVSLQSVLQSIVSAACHRAVWGATAHR
jgi:ABC-type multidrug transport system fused ATPase/permease subunit